MIQKVAIALVAAFLPVALSTTVSVHAGESLPQPQSDYLLHCGGCHGLEGTTAPAAIPVLRGRVGYFMGSEQGREYLVRLPNVTNCGITDNSRLAALMNFVVFQLGGGSVPRGTKSFTGEEIGRLRAKPLTGEDLVEMRAAVVTDLVRRKTAPRSLLEYGAAVETGRR